MLTSLTVAGVVAGVAYVSPLGPGAAGQRPAVAPARGEQPFPPALARHLSTLQEPVPGLEGESGDGRLSYLDEQFQNLAYPDTVVPLSRFAGARQAFDAVKGRGIGRLRAGSWVSLGPTSATDQETKYRFSYVPSQYESSGRVTAMAIAQTCRHGDCRLWVAAAGGGI